MELSESWAAKLADIGNILLIASLVVGVMATYLVVMSSNAKERYLRKQISDAGVVAASATERAAASELEALRLQKELSLQASRGNLFVGENRQKLVDAMKRFAGASIDVRRSASAIMVNGTVVMSVPRGDDTIALAQSLFSVFQDAHWNQPPRPLLSDLQGYGTEIEISQRASPETLAAATALAESLKRLTLSVNGPVRVPEARLQRVGSESAEKPALNTETIVFHVLTHP
jgi:hypothetical protein